MKDTTIGEDLFIDFQEVLQKHSINLDKIVNTTIDQCPNLKEKNIGLLKRLNFLEFLKNISGRCI